MNKRFTDNFCIRLINNKIKKSKEWNLFIEYINKVGNGHWEGSVIGGYYGLQDKVAAGNDGSRGEEITLEQRVNATQKKFYIDI